MERAGGAAYAARVARELRSDLQRLFGFADFRAQQHEIAQHFLGGGSALVLMATGDGKSLCYQLPALVGEGLTIVVSPLIALMDDQTAALRARGLPATCVHSLLDRRQREARLAAALRGDVKLLYVTPERFRTHAQFWSYCGMGIVMRSSSDWVRDGERWQKRPVQRTRGLNFNHNHLLKPVFKGAATTIVTQRSEHPLRADYQRMLDGGTKPNLAKLTLARKAAMSKQQEVFDTVKHSKSSS